MSDSVKQLRELAAAREKLLTNPSCGIDFSAIADELESLRRDPRPITPDVWREVTGESCVVVLNSKLSLSADDALPLTLEVETVDLPIYCDLPNVRTAGDLRELLRLLGEAS